MIIPGAISVAGLFNAPLSPFSANVHGHDAEYLSDDRVLLAYREDVIPGDLTSAIPKAAIVDFSDPEALVTTGVVTLNNAVSGGGHFSSPHIAILSSTRAMMCGLDNDITSITVYLLDITNDEISVLDSIAITNTKNANMKTMSASSAIVAYADDTTDDGMAVIVDAAADTLSLGTAVTLNNNQIVNVSSVAVFSETVAHVCSGNAIYHCSVAGKVITNNDFTIIGNNVNDVHFFEALNSSKAVLVYQATGPKVIARLLSELGDKTARQGSFMMFLTIIWWSAFTIIFVLFAMIYCCLGIHLNQDRLIAGNYFSYECRMVF